MKKIALALVLVGVALNGCTKSTTTKHAEPNVDLIQDMMESPAIKAQDFDTFDRNKGASRLPPEGTVPVGFKPYPYPNNPELAEKNLKNPFAGNFSTEILGRGQKKYETYCAVCHGDKGGGDGPVSVKWPTPIPALTVEKAVKFQDGRIFHIISAGQGIMSSYAYQLVDEKDRWAIVNYVRNLQKMKGNGG